jgi:hypothetical protein
MKPKSMATLLRSLRAELRAHSSEAIEAFLKLVISSIAVEGELRKMNDESERDLALSKLQQSAERFLEMEVKNVLPEPFPKRMSMTNRSTLNLPSEAALRYYRTLGEASEAVSKFLVELKKVRGSAKRVSRGRPSADTHGLLARLAFCYRRIFRTQPTSTPNGTFSNIVTLVLTHQSKDGKVPNDVSRQVRSAIKSLGQK